MRDLTSEAVRWRTLATRRWVSPRALHLWEKSKEVVRAPSAQGGSSALGDGNGEMEGEGERA
jgi:hypothetical protein